MATQERQPNGHGIEESHSSEDLEKQRTNQIEQTQSNPSVEPIRTISRVPGNPNYYEKNGLRTYGDGMDHDHEPPVGESP